MGGTEEHWLVPKTWQGESWWLQRLSLVPAPDSAAHPWQHHNALSETCWINKYSRDTPGHVFFMSLFCYWEMHPLRRLDASGTEVIFIVNNLLEKLALNISTHLGSLKRFCRDSLRVRCSPWPCPRRAAFLAAKNSNSQRKNTLKQKFV